MAKADDEPDLPPVDRTGPIGRMVRFIIGVGLLASLSWPVPYLDRLASPVVAQEATIWILTGISLLAIPYLIDEGLAWGDHGRRVQAFAVGIGIALLISNLTLYGTVWNLVMAGYLMLLQAWVIGTLGLGYLLAAGLGTPGNELRAFAHLSSKLSAERGEPVFIPGALDRLDAWEASTF